MFPTRNLYKYPCRKSKPESHCFIQVAFLYTMASESQVECSQADCLPPIPSGYYAIVNKINGNINIPLTKPTEIPVVASPESLIVSRFTDHFTKSCLKFFYLYCSGKLNISRITIIISLHGTLALRQNRQSIGIIFSMWPSL